MSDVIINGVYRHFKSPDMRYVVRDVALHSETMEELVIYQALYGDRCLWARPANMFCGKVAVDGAERDRFTFLGPYDEEQDGESGVEGESRITIDLPEEVQEAVLAFGIDVEGEISKEVPGVEFEYVQAGSTTGEKSGVLTVVAWFAGIVLVLNAVERIVRTVLNRPFVLSLTEKDNEGKVLRKAEYKVGSELPRRLQTDIKVGNALEVHFKDVER